jgi:iron complex transport system permease protein
MNTVFRRRLLYALPLPILFVSLLLGPSASAEAGKILVWLYGLLFRESVAGPEEALIGTIVWEVRMPRILLTFMVGGALAASGNALQAMFRNPLVAPYILGLSSGAAFGAALALTLPLLPVQPTAFGFALLAVGLAYFLARTRKTVSVVSLILS